jgi:PPOX class probable F420-dependent enzyme
MRKNFPPEELGEFLEQGKCAILATHFRDGRVLLSPVWHEWQDGGFTVLIPAEDIKARHIAREPRVSLVVAEDTPPYRGIEVRGEAKRVPGDVHAIVHRMALRYLGAEHGPAYADAVSQIEAVILRIKPGELRVWDFADEQDIAGAQLPKEL